MCKPILNTNFTDHPILFLVLLDTPIIKQPSASINPVINHDRLFLLRLVLLIEEYDLI